MQSLKIEFNIIDRNRKKHLQSKRKGEKKTHKKIRILIEPVEVKGEKNEVGYGFGADRGRNGLRIIWFVVVFPFVIILLL